MYRKGQECMQPCSHSHVRLQGVQFSWSTTQVQFFLFNDAISSPRLRSPTHGMVEWLVYIGLDGANDVVEGSGQHRTWPNYILNTNFDALIIKYYSPLYVSSLKCSSSGGYSSTHAAYGTVTLYESSWWPVGTQLEWELTVGGKAVGRAS